MTTVRLALAAVPFPVSPQDAVSTAVASINEAADRGADLICFPECFVPGYRALGAPVPPADPEWLAAAHVRVAAAAGEAGIAVALGTERFVEGRLRITVLVVGPDGRTLGWQDKVQLDPTEDDLYEPAAQRSVFTVGEARFGVVICHEGWRYPETVRAAARMGAQIVLHPHFAPPEDGVDWTAFADPRGSFHEAAALCRAAENTVWFATVNHAAPGAPTTSAIIRPDGSLLVAQPRGEAGILIADVDLDEATGFLASRLR